MLLLTVHYCALKLECCNYFGYVQLAGKRDPEQERQVQEWIESILGEQFPAGVVYEDVLRDGQVLCKVMNKLKPGAIPKINDQGGQFKMMENINKYT